MGCIHHLRLVDNLNSQIAAEVAYFTFDYDLVGSNSNLADYNTFTTIQMAQRATGLGIEIPP